MTLTEKVKADIGGIMFKVFEVTGLSTSTGGAMATIDATDLQMNQLKWAEWSNKTATTSAAATIGIGILTVQTTAVVLSGAVTSGDSGVLTVYGS